MIKKFWFTLILVHFVALAVVAQPDADKRIDELIGSKDWFSLIDEYPLLKDSLRQECLRLEADSYISLYTGDRPKALASIGELLAKHQGSLGARLLDFVVLYGQVLYDSGYYSAAADYIQSVAAQFRPWGVESVNKALSYYERLYNACRSLPPVTLSRPAADTRVRYVLRELPSQLLWPRARQPKPDSGRLLTIEVPATLHGNGVLFSLDTGAEHTFVSKKFAERNGLPLMGDTVRVNASKGLRTFIDSMQIGNITVRNLVAYVGTDAGSVYDLLGIDAVLGADFLWAVGETQLCTADSTLLFPAHMTPRPATGINLLSNSLVRVHSGSETMPFLFDTGNASSNSCYLYRPYYNAHRALVDSQARVDTLQGGSYGRLGTSVLKVLDGDCALAIGGRAMQVPRAVVDSNGSSDRGLCYGNIGMCAVMQSRKIILNYKNMFIKIE